MKTEEEYVATAMLLGMVYDKKVHTFYRYNGDLVSEVDADTMEPMTKEMVMQRVRELVEKGVANIHPPKEKEK